MAEFMTMEVGEYIERGLALATNLSDKGFQVLETPATFLDLQGPICHAGALGLAFIGKADDPQTALDHWLEFSNRSPSGKLQAAAKLLGISVELARLAELNHRNGVPAAEIARRLRFGILGLSLRYRPHQRRAQMRSGRGASQTPAVYSPGEAEILNIQDSEKTALAAQ